MNWCQEWAQRSINVRRMRAHRRENTNDELVHVHVHSPYRNHGAVLGLVRLYRHRHHQIFRLIRITAMIEAATTATDGQIGSAKSTKSTRSIEIARNTNETSISRGMTIENVPMTIVGRREMNEIIIATVSKPFIPYFLMRICEQN